MFKTHFIKLYHPIYVSSSANFTVTFFLKYYTEMGHYRILSKVQFVYFFLDSKLMNFLSILWAPLTFFNDVKRIPIRKVKDKMKFQHEKKLNYIFFSCEIKVPELSAKEMF